MRRRPTKARALLAAGLAVLGALALLSPVAAQSAAPPSGVDAQDLRPFLEESLAKNALPAIGAAVFDSERLLALGVAGVRKSGAEAVVEPGDLWHIGSITKSFTSTLVSRLVENGELQWQAKLAELLPEMVADTPFAGVTLEMLASHRSGLPANLTPPETVQLQTSGDGVDDQRRGAVRALVEKPPVHPPGSAFLYSNGGYITVGAALEARLGKPWEELVREHVLEPLALESAGFGAPGTSDLDQPLGHRRGDDGRYFAVNPGPWADNPPLLGPAGTLHMSIRDLARYGREHLRGELGKEALLSPESFRKLHRGVADDYALGWVDQKARDWQGERRVIWHNGSNTFWYAFLALVPDSDLGIAVASNGSIASRQAVEEVAAQLFERFVEGGEEQEP